MPEASTREKADAAGAAALALAGSSDADRRAALHAVADALEANVDRILAANEEDVAAAEKLLAAGEYSRALVDRLELSPEKVTDIAEMVRSVAGQDDPLGRTQAARRLDDGLELYRVSTPIGVVGAIFESRPDALVQIAALALRSGNAVILKGGSEASASNRVLFEIIREAAADHAPDGWAQLVEAREDVDRLLGMDDAVDLLMPRGSSEFVAYIQDNTSIPVLGHTEGVCHVYVDSAADLDQAVEIAVDAKTQYPAVCNAVETLLVHADAADAFLPRVAARLADAGVELRCDARASEAVGDAAETVPATDEDWTTEWGDLVLAVGVVDSLPDAVAHVNANGSKHTESVVTAEPERAATFMRGVDAASVFHNASTRFSDGYRFGLGAEVGISTGKTHARGPVGLEGLTTYVYYLEGSGQVVGTYVGDDARPFTHEAFDGEWRPGHLSTDE